MVINVQNEYDNNHNPTILEDEYEIKKIKVQKKAKEKKLKILDRIFIKIFLSSLLLLSLVLANKYAQNKVDYLMNQNINFIKIGNLFSGSLGFVLPNENDITVYSRFSYDCVVYDEETKINHVYLFTTDAIKPLTSGIVTKIVKNKDHSYNVYITDSSNITYGYLNLQNFDYHIYSFVTNEMIIGKAKYNENENLFCFDLTIEEKGVYHDYYEKSSD